MKKMMLSVEELFDHLRSNETYWEELYRLNQGWASLGADEDFVLRELSSLHRQHHFPPAVDRLVYERVVLHHPTSELTVWNDLVGAANGVAFYLEGEALAQVGFSICPSVSEEELQRICLSAKLVSRDDAPCEDPASEGSVHAMFLEGKHCLRCIDIAMLRGKLTQTTYWLELSAAPEALEEAQVTFTRWLPLNWGVELPTVGREETGASRVDTLEKRWRAEYEELTDKNTHTPTAKAFAQHLGIRDWILDDCIRFHRFVKNDLGLRVSLKELANWAGRSPSTLSHASAEYNDKTETE